jgi:hypothetical protein
MKGERIAQIIRQVQDDKRLLPDCKKCIGCTALEDLYFKGDPECSNLDKDRFRNSFQDHIGDIRKTLGAEKKPEEPVKTTYLERLKQNRQT